MTLHDEIAKAVGSDVLTATPMQGGCIGSVFDVKLANGSRCVAKTMAGDNDLRIEGDMLRYLADHTQLPVPKVYVARKSLLILEYVRNDASLTDRAQVDAARHLARLHSHTESYFGFETNTLIGPLPQPNSKATEWIPFFRDQRLLYMAGLAETSGNLPTPMRRRLETLADKLDHYLIEPAQPSLIHGDLWAGNILCFESVISAFIDPAIYYADAEIELAYSTLFATLGDPFFKAYQEHRAIEPGFFEERCDLYNLYPLLVHVRLFGGDYVSSVDRTLKRFGV